MGKIYLQTTGTVWALSIWVGLEIPQKWDLPSRVQGVRFFSDIQEGMSRYQHVGCL